MKKLIIEISDNGETSLSGQGELTKKEIDHITWILSQMNPTPSDDFIELEKCRECPKWNHLFGYMEGYCEISNRTTLGHYDCEFGRGKTLVEETDEFPTIPNPACEYW